MSNFTAPKENLSPEFAAALSKFAESTGISRFRLQFDAGHDYEKATVHYSCGDITLTHEVTTVHHAKAEWKPPAVPVPLTV